MSKPWLQRPEFATGVIASRDSKQLVAPWVVATVWNGFSAVLGFAAYGEGLQEMPVFLVVALVAFIVFGVLLLGGAMRQTARYLRFRGLRLTLDPFPGSIGGQVGGWVEVPLLPGDASRTRVTLHCIHHYVRGTGEDESRRDDVVWSAETVPEMERTGRGSRIRFVFDVPDGLPETMDRSDDYHYWTLHLAAELPGADLDQSFDLPVYRVDPPTPSRLRFTPPEPDERVLDERGVSVERLPDGLRLVYRQGRYGSAPWAILPFGALCIGAGGFIFNQSALGGGLSIIGTLFGLLFLVPFGLVGLLLTAIAVHMLASGRTVEIAGGRIRSTQSLLGWTSTREVAIDHLSSLRAKVTMQSGQGSTARTAYDLLAVPTVGRPITIGDGIRGAYALDLLRGILEEATGVALETGLQRTRLHAGDTEERARLAASSH